MSAVEHDQVVEQRSSVKVSMNAKGEAQVEVKAYDGVDAVDLQKLREIVVGEYLAAARTVRGQTGGAA